ncbi:MAG TPA: hypothetical protein VG122_09995 [Gemmata sp.]|jgi:hypothetical protein|nr:hypothetical protein [Gemmata sp.]
MDTPSLGTVFRTTTTIASKSGIIEPKQALRAQEGRDTEATVWVDEFAAKVAKTTD